MFLHIHCMWSSYMILVGPLSHLVPLLSPYPCNMVFITDSDLAYEPDDSISSSRHPCAPNHRAGPFEHNRFRIFIIALLRSSKIMIFRGIEIKRAEGCYKSIPTGNFFETFPDCSDPKRVCPYQFCGSRKPFFKAQV